MGLIRVAQTVQVQFNSDSDSDSDSDFLFRARIAGLADEMKIKIQTDKAVSE